MNLSSTCALACFQLDRLGLDHPPFDTPHNQHPKTTVITIGMSSSSGSDISLLYDVNDLRVPAEAGSKLVLLSIDNALSSVCTLSGLWWSRTGSNRRPMPCKGIALPTELRPQTLTEGVPLFYQWILKTDVLSPNLFSCLVATQAIPPSEF